MRGDYVSQPYVTNDEEIAVIFNGELYNCPDSFSSEAEWVVDMYQKLGKSCFKKFDGEYSMVIADFSKNTVYIARDCFGTKPLYFANEGLEFAIATYSSALKLVGFEAPVPLPVNTVIEYRLDNSFIDQQKIYDFNIAQFSENVDEWCESFDAAIQKRIRHKKGAIFVGLSSGYDSGAITASLLKQKSKFFTVSVVGRENDHIMQQRIELLKANGITPIIINENELDKHHWKNWLADNVEDVEYKIINDSGLKVDIGKSVHTDKASLILCGICDVARNNGAKVYLSGSGADEIYSDYGHKGKKFYEHSNFGGLYPTNFIGHFPWSSFFGSTQSAYLAKEEMVAGSFGMEARYPFLDLDVVQKFLNLKSEIKNEVYKSVIDIYLNEQQFPISLNEKIGLGFSKKRRRLLFRG